jgi:hypothetical protein
MRIVGVLILMLSRLHRVVDHFTKSVAEFPEGLASQHSDLPRLRIDTGRGPTRGVQDFVNGYLSDRLRQKSADRSTPDHDSVDHSPILFKGRPRF